MKEEGRRKKEEGTEVLIHRYKPPPSLLTALR
jgi:hypothetical protein